MMEYNVFRSADVAIFERQCQRLERNVPGLRKHKRLVDVDGSIIQIYHTRNGKVIEVYNDEDVGAVYIKSDIALRALSHPHIRPRKKQSRQSRVLVAKPLAEKGIKAKVK